MVYRKSNLYILMGIKFFHYWYLACIFTYLFLVVFVFSFAINTDLILWTLKTDHVKLLCFHFCVFIFLAHFVNSSTLFFISGGLLALGSEYLLKEVHLPTSCISLAICIFSAHLVPAVFAVNVIFSSAWFCSVTFIVILSMLFMSSNSFLCLWLLWILCVLFEILTLLA